MYAVAWATEAYRGNHKHLCILYNYVYMLCVCMCVTVYNNIYMYVTVSGLEIGGSALVCSYKNYFRTTICTNSTISYLGVGLLVDNCDQHLS